MFPVHYRIPAPSSSQTTLPNDVTQMLSAHTRIHPIPSPVNKSLGSTHGKERMIKSNEKPHRPHDEYVVNDPNRHQNPGCYSSSSSCRSTYQYSSILYQTNAIPKTIALSPVFARFPTSLPQPPTPPSHHRIARIRSRDRSPRQPTSVTSSASVAPAFKIRNTRSATLPEQAAVLESAPVREWSGWSRIGN